MSLVHSDHNNSAGRGGECGDRPDGGFQSDASATTQAARVANPASRQSAYTPTALARQDGCDVAESPPPRSVG